MHCYFTMNGTYFSRFPVNFVLLTNMAKVGKRVYTSGIRLIKPKVNIVLMGKLSQITEDIKSDPFQNYSTNNDDHFDSAFIILSIESHKTVNA